MSCQMTWYLHYNCNCYSQKKDFVTNKTTGYSFKISEVENFTNEMSVFSNISLKQ